MLLSAFLFSIVSCGETNPDGNSGSDTTKKIDTAKTVENVKANVLFSLPAPVDIASILMDHPGSEFNAKILNPTANSSKYNTNKSLALNLGIFTADLSYTSFSKQNQLTKQYMNVSKEIAEKLGIANIIDQAGLELINAEKLDKDAMQKLISETFMNTESYLKENGRSELMSIILIGGWVEAQYLATKLSKSNLKTNPELAKRIIEQSTTLELMLLLVEESAANAEVTSLKPDLQKIKEAMDKLSTQEPTEENYKNFCNVIEQIRTSYIS